MHSACRKLVALVLAATVSQLGGCSAPRAPSPRERSRVPHTSAESGFIATAYSGGGLTASGTPPYSGVVAADPAVLPLGSRIRVHGAGQYSGEYVVHDTGGKIRGRKIDIYMPRHAQAKRFGRQRVSVQVLRYGDDRHRRVRSHHHAKHRHHRPTL